MIKLNYYSHLLLNSKYKFIINLFIILIIYSLFYGNTIGYCMMKATAGETVSSSLPGTVSAESKAATDIKPISDVFELEKMKVHEKIIAYTNMEPDQLVEGFQKWKAKDMSYRGQPLPVQEKMYLRNTIHGSADPNYYNKVHYLFRMYRRLMGL